MTRLFQMTIMALWESLDAHHKWMSTFGDCEDVFILRSTHFDEGTTDIGCHLIEIVAT